MAHSVPHVGRSRRLLSRLPNSAWIPLLVTLVGVATFVAVRYEWATQRDVSKFALAGDAFSDPAKVPSNLHVEPGTGYDGQFFYRLALDPLDVSAEAHGIALDQPLRKQRIAYPFLAFLLSGGSSDLLPWSMVLVNAAGLVALAGLGGLIAQASGRHAIWGLWFPLFFGFVFTLSRDLSEITEAAFLLAGLLAFRRSRWWWAAVLLSGAVLARETAVVVVLALAACRIFDIARRESRLGAADASWLVPGAAFVGWQMYCLITTGILPVTGGAAGNGFALPFQQFFAASSDWFSHLHSGAGLIHLLEVLALVTVTVMALLSLRSTTAPTHERVALVILVIVASVTKIGTNLWREQDDFRQLADLYVVAGLVLLGSRLKLLLPCALVTAAAAATAGLRLKAA